MFNNNLDIRRRRSKHCKDGRDFSCHKCGKSYLSLPALNNHITRKHNEGIIKDEKRPRGRPRKYVRNYNCLSSS